MRRPGACPGRGRRGHHLAGRESQPRGLRPRPRPGGRGVQRQPRRQVDPSAGNRLQIPGGSHSSRRSRLPRGYSGWPNAVCVISTPT